METLEIKKKWGTNPPHGAKILGYFGPEQLYITHDNWKKWTDYKNEIKEFCNYAMNIKINSIYDYKLVELLENYREIVFRHCKNNRIDIYRYQELLHKYWQIQDEQLGHDIDKYNIDNIDNDFKQYIKCSRLRYKIYIEACRQAVIIAIATNLGIGEYFGDIYYYDIGKIIYNDIFNEQNKFNKQSYDTDNYINSIGYIYWELSNFYEDDFNDCLEIKEERNKDEKVICIPDADKIIEWILLNITSKSSKFIAFGKRKSKRSKRLSVFI
jgi:hypothetical protein